MMYFAPLNCVLAYIIVVLGSRICEFRLFALEQLLLLSQDQLFVVSYMYLYISYRVTLLCILCTIGRERERETGTTASISDFCFVKNRSNPQCCSDTILENVLLPLSIFPFTALHLSPFVLCVAFSSFINESTKKKRSAKDMQKRYNGRASAEEKELHGYIDCV